MVCESAVPKRNGKTYADLLSDDHALGVCAGSMLTYWIYTSLRYWVPEADVMSRTQDPRLETGVCITVL